MHQLEGKCWRELLESQENMSINCKLLSNLCDQGFKLLSIEYRLENS